MTEKWVEVQQRRGTNNIWRVLVRFSGSPTNSKEVDDYLEEICTIYNRNEPFIIIYDAKDVGFGSAAYVSRQVEFMRSKDMESRRLIKKCAIIAPTSFVQGILEIIFKAKPAACPLKIVNSMEEAKHFVKD